MKVGFIIQGEGRGHFTQAIALQKILVTNGHELVAVCIGKSKERIIPKFVIETLNAPQILFDSPNFIKDKKGKGVLIFHTLIYNLFNLPTYLKSLKKLRLFLDQQSPELIINFYDILGGIYNFMYRPKVRFWVIGHQYLIKHPDFPFHKGSPIQKFLFYLNTELTSLRSHQQIALSFQPYAPSKIDKLKVFPPLLREELKVYPQNNGNFLLAYMVNSGYFQEVIVYALNHPSIDIEVFCDIEKIKIDSDLPSNLLVHAINDLLFLEKLATCKAYLSTAGFESICEAMFYNKPVLLVPIKGHYEQQCNALDAKNAGAGIIADFFDFDLIDNFTESKLYKPSDLREFSKNFEPDFIQLINSSLNRNQ